MSSSPRPLVGLSALHRRVREFILSVRAGSREQTEGLRQDDVRDELLADIAALQSHACEPFARLCAARDARFDAGPDAWPALPTDVFRHARVACFDEGEELRTFLTSGTTSGARGRHAFSDLLLYDLAASSAAERCLFGAEGARLVMLAPHPDEAPESSLSYMLGRFEDWFESAGASVWIMREGKLDLERFREVMAEGETTAVLGTSFALVHLDEMLGPQERFSVGKRGLVMQTGGFKGRARELDAGAMRAMLSERFGVPQTRVVSEYGMTELASQMYGRGILDCTLADDGLERLWVPPWVRATPVDPETLAPVPEGQEGILRIDDCANLHSVCSIQTADRARREGSDLVLLGRAAGATPRGCSLAAEEALGGLGEGT